MCKDREIQLKSVSIIISTCDRPEMLNRCVERLAHLEVPDGVDCELVLVNNSPTDYAAEFKRFCGLANMRVQLLHEPRRGRSYAHNLAISAARGDILMFTDDDVMLPREWIRAMCAPIIAGAACAVVGGVKISPDLERPWMGNLHKALFVSTKNMGVAHDVELVGANMAVAKQALQNGPRFDVELGPGALGFYDDTLFSRQLKAAGCRIAPVFNVVAEHCFDAARLSRRSILDHARRKGKSLAYLRHHWDHRTIGSPRWKFIAAILRLLKWRCLRASECLSREGMPEWEITLVSHIHLYRQYLVERRRKPNYELFEFNQG